MKSKKMRVLFSEFSDTMSEIIETEFRKNKTFMSDWIKYPHAANVDIEKRSKSNDYLNVDEGDIPIYYPK